MNQIDTYFRVLSDLKKYNAESRECIVAKKYALDAFGTDEKINITRTICHIEEEWVEQIEAGLIHIEKAIKEERQFIRSNGEVVPIEKVKHVSRDSVEHLSRHSNLITREVEGQDIVPDELYTVERLSDYAVYENRFLYMLLCYLRDFISIRYNKILEFSNTYDAEMTVDKVVTSNKRRFIYSLKINEIRKDDDFLKESNVSKNIIDRIDLILKTVMMFLQTPLMEQVAKVPMIKPPITKTNVLKMNNNFKGAVSLYDFVSSYNSDGFSIERRVKALSPFNDDIKNDFTDTMEIQSFIMYQYGLNLKERLKKTFDREQQRRADAESEKQKEQIKALARRVKESGVGIEEYMLMLEKRNRSLENDEAKLAMAKQDIEKLNLDIDELNKNINQLNLEIENQKLEMAELIKKHELEIENLNAENEQKIAIAKDECDQRIDEINLEHQSIIDQLREEQVHALSSSTIRIEELTRLNDEERNEHARIVRELNENADKVIRETKEQTSTRVREAEENLRKQITDAKQKAEERVSIAETTCRKATDENKRLKAENKKIIEEKSFNDARLNALRKQHGLLNPTDDYTSREAFKELEQQYSAFMKFFNDEWKKTKKNIRKSVFKDVKETEIQEKLNKQEERKNKKIKQEVPTQTQAVENQNVDILSFGDDSLNNNQNSNAQNGAVQNPNADISNEAQSNLSESTLFNDDNQSPNGDNNQN